MKKQFKVAENAFTITLPDTSFPAWETIADRFEPFSLSPLSTTDESDLEINVTVGELPEVVGEMIYEPDPGSIGLVCGCVSKLPDGSFVMLFRHIEEQPPRVWMKVAPTLDRAEIVLKPQDDNDSYFLSHVLMIAYMLGSCRSGCLMFHASAIVCEGKAYLFQGKSGTGKSTHAGLWLRHVPGSELLNDDHPVVRFAADGVAVAYGSPWSGKTHCYRNASAPLGACVRIVRAPENELKPLRPLQAYASLTPSVFSFPIVGEQLRELRHKTIERLLMTVPCYEMHCRPDPAAAQTCHQGLTSTPNP